MKVFKLENDPSHFITKNQADDLYVNEGDELNNAIKNVPRVNVFTTKIITSNKFKYYILKTFPSNEFVHVLSLKIKEPNGVFNEFKSETNVSVLENLNVALNDYRHISTEAETYGANPPMGLDLSQYQNKNGIVLYVEKTPSVALSRYFISENNSSWIYFKVAYLSTVLR